MRQFSPKPAQARKVFGQFVLDGVGTGHREEFHAVKEQGYLGDDEFLDRVDRKINTELSRPRRIGLAKIEAAVRRHFELPVNLWRSRSKERRGSFGRALVCPFFATLTTVSFLNSKIQDSCSGFLRGSILPRLGRLKFLATFHVDPSRFYGTRVALAIIGSVGSFVKATLERRRWLNFL